MSAHPLVQAMLLAGLRVQLDILLALTQVAIGLPVPPPEQRTPDIVAARRRFPQQVSSCGGTALACATDLVALGGRLRPGDLAQLAAEAEISADAAFVLLSVAGELYGNWTTEDDVCGGCSSELQAHARGVRG